MSSRSPIARIEALIIAVPAEGNAFAEDDEETVLVRVTDENGLYGIGECITAFESQGCDYLYGYGSGECYYALDCE